jgi:hypothetical protein
MKFPWLPYGVMIAACVAFAAYVGFGRHVEWRSLRAGETLQTPGVVRALHEQGGDGAALTRATVKLFDGSTIEGEVAPGCLVFVGDRVVVTDVGLNAHLVFPETPR